jgi:hypothetical protein
VGQHSEGLAAHWCKRRDGKAAHNLCKLLLSSPKKLSKCLIDTPDLTESFVGVSPMVLMQPDAVLLSAEKNAGAMGPWISQEIHGECHTAVDTEGDH